MFDTAIECRHEGRHDQKLSQKWFKVDISPKV